MLIIPLRLEVPDNQLQFEISFSQLLMCCGYGALGGIANDRICRAPIVEDEDDSGSVVGFIQFATAEWAVSPVLDDFIDAEWNLI